MKYFLTIILIVVFIPLVSSQNVLDYKEYYLGAGYAVGINSFSQINNVLDKYNNSNVQEKEFKHLTSPNGFGFVLGTTQSFFNFEFGFTQIQQRRKTTFNDGTDLYQRDVRLRLNSFYLGTGIFLPAGDQFGIGANVSGDYFRTKLSTRQALEKSVGRNSFISPSADSSWGITIDLRFYFGPMEDHGSKFMIKPYYSLIFEDLDTSEFDDNINGEGSSSSTKSIQNLSHFGIKFIMNYSVRQ